MHFFIGSTNPVKINSVKLAIAEHWPDATVTGFDVPSGVSDQPVSDEETRQGSAHRARAALEVGLNSLNLTSSEVQNSTDYIGIGLEGGVFTTAQDELWSTVWCTLIDSQGTQKESNGGRIKVPDRIAKIIREGGEMSPVVEQLTGHTDVKQKQGMFGVITKGFVNRTEEYTAIAKVTIGLWYGRDWDAGLSA